MRRIVPLGLVLAAMACGRGGTASPQPGLLQATWSGRDVGSGSLEATALYCPRDSTLQIVSHAGDRGIGVALHLASAVPDTGTFGFVHPETQFIVRPAATGAYRFLTIEALHPYVSRNGEFRLTEIGPDWISGSVEMTLVAQSGPDTVVVRGSFVQVPLDSSITPCGLAPPKPAEIF